MSNYLVPDVYVEEVSAGARSIEATSTSIAGLVGSAPNAQAHLGVAYPINNWSEFTREFCTERSDGQERLLPSTNLSHAVFGFFLNGGARCYVVNVPQNQSIGGGRYKSGLELLEQIDDISIVCAPGYTDADSYNAVITHCEAMKNRVGILDAPGDVDATKIDALKTVALPPASPAPVPPGAGTPGTPAPGGTAPAGL